MRIHHSLVPRLSFQRAESAAIAVLTTATTAVRLTVVMALATMGGNGEGARDDQRGWEQRITADEEAEHPEGNQQSGEPGPTE